MLNILVIVVKGPAKIGIGKRVLEPRLDTFPVRMLYSATAVYYGLHAAFKEHTLLLYVLNN